MAADDTKRVLAAIDSRAPGLKLSDRALSLKAGLSADFVRNLRRGKVRSSSAENLRRIAEQLGYDLEQLLSFDPANADPVPSQQGSRVAQLRTERGWPIETLAEKCRIPVKKLARIESGKLAITHEWALRLGDAFEIHPLEVLEPLPGLKPDEKAVLETYRGLRDEQKGMVRSVLGAIAQSPDVKKQAS